MQTLYALGEWLSRVPLRYTFVIAIVIRILWVFVAAPQVPNALGGARWAKELHGTKVSAESLRLYYETYGPVSPDFNQCYDPYAVSLTKGHGFADRDGSLTAYVAPLYSGFLALIYVTVGRSLEAIRIAQLCLELISIFLVFKLSSQAFAFSTARLAALGYAVHPLLFYQSALVLSETLFTTALLLAALAIQRSVARVNPGWLDCAAGFVVGLAALVRPTAALLPLAVGAGAIVMRQLPIRASLQKTLLMCVGTTAAVGPWIFRNYLAFDQFIPISSVLFNTTAQSAGRPALGVADWFFLRSAPLMNDPLGTIGNGLSSSVRIWYTTNSALFDPIVAAIQLPLLVLAIVGAVRAVKHRMPVSVLAAIPIYHFVVVFLAAASTLVRYLVPIVPFLLILAAYAVTRDKGTSEPAAF